MEGTCEVCRREILNQVQGRIITGRKEKCSVFFSHSQRIVTHNKVGVLSYVTSAQVLSVYLSRNDNSSVWAVVGGVLEYNYYIIRKKLKMTHFLKYHE